MDIPAPQPPNDNTTPSLPPLFFYGCTQHAVAHQPRGVGEIALKTGIYIYFIHSDEF